jgi:hypothetical protein
VISVMVVVVVVVIVVVDGGRAPTPTGGMEAIIDGHGGMPRGASAPSNVGLGQSLESY